MLGLFWQKFFKKIEWNNDSFDFQISTITRINYQTIHQIHNYDMIDIESKYIMDMSNHITSYQKIWDKYPSALKIFQAHTCCILRIFGSNPKKIIIHQDYITIGYCWFPSETHIVEIDTLRKTKHKINDNYIKESSPNSPIPFITLNNTYEISFDENLHEISFCILINNDTFLFKSSAECYNLYTDQIDPIWIYNNKKPIIIYKDDEFKITCDKDGNCKIVKSII